MLKLISAIASVATIITLLFFLTNKYMKVIKRQKIIYHNAYQELTSVSAHIYKIANHTYKLEDLKEKCRYEYPYTDILKKAIT